MGIGLLDADYKLGTPFEIEILADRTGIGITYDQHRFVKLDHVTFEDCYFKAGCYTQSNPSKGDKPDDFGEVVIYSLKVTHD